MTTFVIGHHKYVKLPRMLSLRRWFLPKADDLRDRSSQIWRNWYRWKDNSIIYLLIGNDLKNSKNNEIYSHLKLTIPISFSRIQLVCQPNLVTPEYVVWRSERVNGGIVLPFAMTEAFNVFFRLPSEAEIVRQEFYTKRREWEREKEEHMYH
ncbi:hypothetical protein CQW23_23833 [Capsicum baccatum]|uniref:Uncharacterized protein n=1 Tax=Capsicum baccatum TaxID=33114 RepID=A0A2G2VT61_CAPBA|nr:hypothetical protein CQW23_23833 [Capsicum baccatum]